LVCFSTFGAYILSEHYATTNLSSFIFGDDALVSHDTGILTGWGWVDYCRQDTSSTDTSEAFTTDWLFKATVAPVPAATWLFGSGLIGLIAVARHRKV
jgi:hypothetical protein